MWMCAGISLQSLFSALLLSLRSAYDLSLAIIENSQSVSINITDPLELATATTLTEDLHSEVTSDIPAKIPAESVGALFRQIPIGYVEMHRRYANLGVATITPSVGGSTSDGLPWLSRGYTLPFSRDRPASIDEVSDSDRNVEREAGLLVTGQSLVNPTGGSAEQEMQENWEGQSRGVTTASYQTNGLESGVGGSSSRSLDPTNSMQIYGKNWISSEITSKSSIKYGYGGHDRTDARRGTPNPATTAQNSSSDLLNHSSSGTGALFNQTGSKSFQQTSNYPTSGIPIFLRRAAAPARSSRSELPINPPNHRRSHGTKQIPCFLLRMDARLRKEEPGHCRKQKIFR